VEALNKRVHPYIPNFTPEIKREMMREIGIKGIEELYADIPQKYF
jgi:glycine dehydrogenase subunit 1